jgi:hypothetical protein
VNIIRKISIGPDYMKSMHYVVGQDVLRGSATIDTILMETDNSISIYILNQDKEIVKWKSFSSSMPLSIEYNIDF